MVVGLPNVGKSTIISGLKSIAFSTARKQGPNSQSAASSFKKSNIIDDVQRVLFPFKKVQDFVALQKSYPFGYFKVANSKQQSLCSTGSQKSR